MLGGRVIHAQPAAGHRTGIEPVLLAAAVAARPGQRVLEAGCGSGAGLLCLAARVAGVGGLGIEIDAALAALAAENVAANGFAGLAIATADIGEFRATETFDHAFANPPWHDSAGTASPDAAKERAKRAAGDTFRLWASRLGSALRHHGTLTFVVAAAHLPACLAAFAEAACGSPAILPLWPRAGAAAKLVLLQSRRGGRGPARLLPGLVLHEQDGAFTAEAEAILRGGGSITL